MTHRSASITTRLLTVSGITGLVIATAALAAPAAGAATQRPAAIGAPAAKAAAGSCTAADSKSIKVTPHLSGLHATGQYKKGTKKTPTKVVLALKGSPSLALNLAFSGNVNCTKSLTAVKIPIAGSPLVLKLTPELNFTASGNVKANFTWTENINIGFTVSGKKFTQGAHSLTSKTKVSLTGDGTAGMKLDLDAAIETVGGIAGVKGSIGPDITATVTDDTDSGAACANGSYSTDANFIAYFNALFFSETFHSPVWQLGSKVPFSNCVGGDDE
ncbi:MAG TPA: hypothetical protein VIZ43_14190 [Trebonia sp.]